MIDKLSQGMHFYQEALNLRHQRQEVLAANIANADTPGYKARDFDFASTLGKVMSKGRAGGQGLAMAATRPGHVAGAISGGGEPQGLQYRNASQPSLDGNTVEMDQERAQFLDNALRYQASLRFTEHYVQQMKTAMQPE